VPYFTNGQYQSAPSFFSDTLDLERRRKPHQRLTVNGQQ
jgi:hypothetical protein